jgi:hypothetical protein
LSQRWPRATLRARRLIDGHMWAAEWAPLPDVGAQKFGHIVDFGGSGQDSPVSARWPSLRLSSSCDFVWPYVRVIYLARPAMKHSARSVHIRSTQQAKSGPEQCSDWLQKLRLRASTLPNGTTRINSGFEHQLAVLVGGPQWNTRSASYMKGQSLTAPYFKPRSVFFT